MDEENISRYHFSHKTANFIICKICGNLPVIISDIAGKCYGIVNVNCLDKVDQHTDDEKTLRYGTEITEDRLTHRKNNWIGRVIFD